jgi:hypothetical protein
MLPVRYIVLWFAGLVISLGADPNVFESRYTGTDFELTADPAALQWRNVGGVFISRNYLGEHIPDQPTEIRSRWTNQNLYLRHVCPYDDLNLKPEPNVTAETPRLWDWDVGEAFIGADLEHKERYKELQVSPQGE